LDVNFTNDQLKAAPTLALFRYPVVGIHFYAPADPVPEGSRSPILVDGDPVGQIGIEGRDQSKKMPGLIHLDPVPKDEVLVVGAPSNVDVGYRLIYALDSGQGLYGLQYIRLGQPWQDSKFVQVHYYTGIGFLVDSRGQEFIDGDLLQFLIVLGQ